MMPILIGGLAVCALIAAYRNRDARLAIRIYCRRYFCGGGVGGNSQPELRPPVGIDPLLLADDEDDDNDEKTS